MPKSETTRPFGRWRLPQTLLVVEATMRPSRRRDPRVREEDPEHLALAAKGYTEVEIDEILVRRFEEAWDGSADLLLPQEATEEDVRRARREGVFVRERHLIGRLVPGVRPAWTVGTVHKELAAIFGVPPSRPTIRKALRWLCERGLIREERRGPRGGRAIYRWVRYWTHEELRELGLVRDRISGASPGVLGASPPPGRRSSPPGPRPREPGWV